MWDIYIRTTAFMHMSVHLCAHTYVTYIIYLINVLNTIYICAHTHARANTCGLKHTRAHAHTHTHTHTHTVFLRAPRSMKSYDEHMKKKKSLALSLWRWASVCARRPAHMSYWDLRGVKVVYWQASKHTGDVCVNWALSRTAYSFVSYSVQLCLVLRTALSRTA